MIFIVYCTMNIVNKFIYIGVHKCESTDFDGYLGCGVYANQPSSYNHPKTRFQAAVQEFGPKNFKRVIIKVFKNKEDAFLLEEDLVNDEFLKRKDVYNQVRGGIIGADTSKPCYQYDLKGNFIAEFSSRVEAGSTVNREATSICRGISFKIRVAGCFWSDMKFDTLDIAQYKTGDNKIPVFQYSNTGEYDCCYESISDAARVNNIPSTNISRACKLGYLTNNKYFSYELKPQFSQAKTESLKNRTVYQYTMTGEFIAEYKSCSAAEKAINAKRGLSTAIKLGRNFAGFQWRLEKFDSIEPSEMKYKARKVGQYDLDGNLIKIYDTVMDCVKDFSGCRFVLHGERKTAHGYTFKYLD